MPTYAIVLLAWAAALAGFLAGCFWAGRSRDTDLPEDLP